MKLFVCALEPSSNIHLRELKKHLNDDVRFYGVFERDLGEPLYDLSNLAIMGFVDALSKLRFFLKLRDELVELAGDCDKVLLMDSSGFNLPLAKKLRKKYPKKEIIYYILPQAWAWKRSRVGQLEKYCSKLCSILPFEKDIYNDKDKISYVGHPLLDEITKYKTKIEQTNVIAYMPGSRKSEIMRLLPIYKKIASKIKDKKSILIIPSRFSKDEIKDIYGNIEEFFEVSTSTKDTLFKSEFAFICSGTATLESALIGTPFVLSYIANPLDYFVGKMLVKLKYIGLANIMYEKIDKTPLHEEFLQDEVSVDSLLHSYKTFEKEEFGQKVKKLREYLKHGSSCKVAKIITSE